MHYRIARHLTIILFSTMFGALLLSTVSVVAWLNTTAPLRRNMYCDMSGLSVGITWLIIIALSTLATTIYLNLYTQIRENHLTSFTSFFLLPFCATVFFVVSFELYSDWFLTLSIFLPYIAFLTIHFINFRKQVKKQQNLLLEK